MTILSVNINKIATLRNARGEDYPNLLNMELILLNMVLKALQFIQDQMKGILDMRMQLI